MRATGRRTNAYRCTKGLTAADEAILAARAQAGDDEARNLLVLDNLSIAYLAARKYGRNLPADVDDIAAECVLGLFSAVKGYSPAKGRFSTWAMQWCRSRVSTMASLHRAKRRRHVRDHSYDLSLISDDSTDPSWEAVRIELGAHAERALASLPQGAQRIVRRYYLENESMRTIGEDIGVSGERVRQIIAAAVKLMQRRVDAHAVDWK